MILVSPCGPPNPADVAENPAKGFPIELSKAPVTDMRRYDIVVAFNGSNHYVPTVPISSVEVPNWALNVAIEAIQKAKAYSQMAADASDGEQDMVLEVQKFQKKILDATSSHLVPWSNREPGAGRALLPVGWAGGETASTSAGTQTAETPTAAAATPTPPPPAAPEKKQTPEEWRSQFTIPEAKVVKVEDAKNPRWLQCEHRESSKAKRCGETFTRQNDYKDHFINVHLGRLKCEQCNKSFSKKSNLDRHLREFHTSKEYKCTDDTCDAEYKVFKTEDAFLHHNFYYHDAHDGIECPNCSNLFYPQSYFQRHLNGCTAKKEGTKKTIACSAADCDKKFSYRQAMHRHYSAVHSDNPDFVCAVCERKVTTQQALEIHMATHEGSFRRIKIEGTGDLGFDPEAAEDDVFDPRAEDEGGEDNPISLSSTTTTTDED